MKGVSFVVYAVVLLAAWHFGKMAKDVRELSPIRHNQNNLTILETTQTATRNAYRIIESGDSTGNAYCRVVERVRSGTPGFQPEFPASPPYHIHPSQDEKFVVLKGVMGYKVDGEIGKLQVGSSVTVPAGAKHFFFNAGDVDADGTPLPAGQGSELEIDITLTPCNGADVFFENLAGLAYEYHGLENVPPPQMVLLFGFGGVELADLPVPVAWLVKHVAPRLAQLLGFQPSYPEYRSAGTLQPAPAA